jgi:hypothetical protein
MRNAGQRSSVGGLLQLSLHARCCRIVERDADKAYKRHERQPECHRGVALVIVPGCLEPSNLIAQSHCRLRLVLDGPYRGFSRFFVKSSDVAYIPMLRNS